MTGCRVPWIAVAVLTVSCAMARAADADAARRRDRTVVTIQTIPSVAGVRVRQAGRAFTTDHNGRVRMSVRRYRDGRLNAEGFPFATPVIQPKTVRPGVIASFSRFGWHGWPKVIEVGLALSYRIRIEFADAKGDPIDPRRVQRLVIESNLGTRTVGAGVHSLRLQGSRVAEPRRVQDGGPYGRHGALTSKSVGYSVREVVVDGSNVVNRGEVRFYPFRTRVVPIELLFFDMDVVSTDALFGNKIGSRVEIIGPDGRTVRVPLDRNGHVHLGRLPRGNYRARSDASGLGASRPVTLSRDQLVDVQVLSVIDLLVLGSGAGALAIGLLLIRRPRLRAHIRQRLARRPRPRLPVSP